MSNDHLTDEARTLLEQMNEHDAKIGGCVAPFIDSLQAAFPQDQLSADEATRLLIDILEQLGNRLPEVFGIDALLQFVELQEYVRKSAPRVFARAQEQAEGDNS
jgi:hypothetical protein